MQAQKGGPIKNSAAETKPIQRRLRGSNVSVAVGALAFNFLPGSAAATIVHPIAAGNERPATYSRSVTNEQIIGQNTLTHIHRPDHAAASRSEQRTALPDIPAGTPRAIGYTLLMQEGGDATQWNCLDTLWERESGWDPAAYNSASGATGIPQALPGEKMASAGSDWRTNPVTQIRWGLTYISEDYGTPCSALEHSNAYGYY